MIRLKDGSYIRKDLITAIIVLPGTPGVFPSLIPTSPRVVVHWNDGVTNSAKCFEFEGKQPMRAARHYAAQIAEELKR